MADLHEIYRYTPDNPLFRIKNLHHAQNIDNIICKNTKHLKFTPKTKFYQLTSAFTQILTLKITKNPRKCTESIRLDSGTVYDGVPVTGGAQCSRHDDLAVCMVPNAVKTAVPQTGRPKVFFRSFVKRTLDSHNRFE